MFGKKEFAIASNLRFISRTNFMLKWVEHKKKLYNFAAWISIRVIFFLPPCFVPIFRIFCERIFHVFLKDLVTAVQQ